MSEPGEGEAPNRFLRWLSSAAIAVVSTLLFFLLVEGLFSSYVAWRTMFPTHRLAERHHTQHDSLLGWANVPGLSLPAFYGPGRDLSINGQGFRADRDYAPVPEGRRLVCSGDSFAMGYGVGDSDTWCSRLADLVPGLETVNLGQGGYGIDQAFLWFRRDAAPLDHDVHLFTLTTGDFERTATDEFSGYAKPVLEIRGGRLEVVNAPLPDDGVIGAVRRSPFKLLAFRSIRSLFTFSRSLRQREEAQGERDRRLYAVVSKIFEEVAAIDRDKGSALAVVHLPTEREYRDGRSRNERVFLQRELRRLGLAHWDLLDEFQELSRAELAKLFIPPHDPITSEFPGASGHYNELGNAFVAERLRDRLAAAGWLQSGSEPSPRAALP